MLTTLIPLTLSHHPTLSVIALDRSSRRHLVSLQSWREQVFAGRPTQMSPRVRIHRTSLMSSSLLLQQAYLVRLTWMVCEMGGKLTYSCGFVGCCFLDLFKTSRSIFVQFASSFYSKRRWAQSSECRASSQNRSHNQCLHFVYSTGKAR